MDNKKIIVKPTINENTGNFELLDKDGNVVGTSINGNNRLTDEEIRQATIEKNTPTPEEKEQALKEMFIFSSIVIIIVLLLYIIAHQKH